MPENDEYKVFIGKLPPKKVQLLFLYVKMLVQKFDERFYTL